MKRNNRSRINLVFIIVVLVFSITSFSLSAKPNQANILNQTHSIIFNRKIFIPYQKLQRCLYPFFPYNKTAAHLVHLNLFNPNLMLDQKQNRFVIDADIILKLPFYKKELNGSIAFSAIPSFDAKKQAIVIQQPKMERFSMQEIDSNLVNQMQNLITNLVMPLLDSFPVYTFKPHQLSFAGKRIRPEKFIVVNNGVMVHLKID